MKLTMGVAELELGGEYLGTLRESNDVLGDLEALRARMHEDGYLLIRGLHDRDRVKSARRFMLEDLERQGLIAPGTELMDGIMPPGAQSVWWEGQKRITHAKPLLDVYEGDRVFSFFEKFLGGPVRTYDYKWIRVIAREGFTGAHYDIIYMGRGTTDLYTCWTPFGDVSLENGPLVVCEGSHHFEPVKQTYGQVDVDRDLMTGWFSTDPKEVVDHYGGRWLTAEFKMGDALILGMYTLHGSLNNKTERWRISGDTRYQLASEPIDERWIGENPIGHRRDAERRDFAELRKEWKV